MITKDIPNLDSYTVSEDGRVFRKERIIKTKNGKSWTIKEKELNLQTDSCGYKTVNLRKGDKRSRYSVHRLVALAFNPLKKHEEMQVNHIDGDKTNNHFTNLEWVTCKDNVKHAAEHGLRGNFVGEKNGGSKLSEKDVISIRNLWQSGKMQKEISAQFNITPATVSLIIRKKLWAHI